MANDTPAPVPVVGSVLQSLPLKEVFAAPLVAVIEAHNAACSALETFIEKVGHEKETGKIKFVEFKYTENEPDGGQLTRSIQVPLLAVLPLPAFGVDRLTVDFDVKVDASEANKDEDQKGLEGEVGAGIGPVSVKLKGSLSHKSEQTRKTDTSARYTVHMEASRQPMPEAFNRVIDTLLANMRAQPVAIKPKTDTSSAALPASTSPLSVQPATQPEAKQS